MNTPRALHYHDRAMLAREDVRMWAERVKRPLSATERISIIVGWQTNHDDGDALVASLLDKTSDF